MQGMGRRPSNDNDLDLLARQGLFTAAFTVQVCCWGTVITCCVRDVCSDISIVKAAACVSVSGPLYCTKRLKLPASAPSERELLGVQNISFNITAPRNEASTKASMSKLVGAEVFVISIQPAEKELQASNDDHAGPLHIEGESPPVALPAQQHACPIYVNSLCPGTGHWQSC